MAFLRLDRAPVTALLLAAIFAMFGVEYFYGALEPTEQGAMALYRLGAIAPPLLTEHQYWRAVTAMFLHADWVHVGANAFSLWQLGSLFEAMFGSRRFAFIYFTTGIVASFASATANHLSVGASGAVLGILGAFIFSIKRSPQWKHQPWTKSLLGQLMFSISFCRSRSRTSTTWRTSPASSPAWPSASSRIASRHRRRAAWSSTSHRRRRMSRRSCGENSRALMASTNGESPGIFVPSGHS